MNHIAPFCSFLSLSIPIHSEIRVPDCSPTHTPNQEYVSVLFIQFSGIFRLKKPKVAFAFLLMLFICRLHLRSLGILGPQYGWLLCIPLCVWLFSWYNLDDVWYRHKLTVLALNSMHCVNLLSVLRFFIPVANVEYFLTSILSTWDRLKYPLHFVHGFHVYSTVLFSCFFKWVCIWNWSWLDFLTKSKHILPSWHVFLCWDFSKYLYLRYSTKHL